MEIDQSWFSFDKNKQAIDSETESIDRIKFIRCLAVLSSFLLELSIIVFTLIILIHYNLIPLFLLNTVKNHERSQVKL